jgi:peptidoglycan/xylan/chitin deacetylase (PgdA/CDA1 family)
MQTLNKKYILLSFDVEEFDIPLEYGLEISKEEQFAVSKTGLTSLLNLLDTLNICVTLFTTTTFAIKYPKLIKKAAEKHEIASHGLDHNPPTDNDIIKSKKILEEIIKTEIKGFRCPRLQKISEENLSSGGFTYNSSENPIYLPGRYNNFFKPRTVYVTNNNILNIPISASPIVRFPLFWLAFKNIPLPIIKFFSKWTLKHDNYLNIFYHPWEFSDLTSYALPKMIKRYNHNKMLKRFENYLRYLQSLNASFITMHEFEKIIRKEYTTQSHHLSKKRRT